jgi:hypothetical protein
MAVGASLFLQAPHSARNDSGSAFESFHAWKMCSIALLQLLIFFWANMECLRR